MHSIYGGLTLHVVYSHLGVDENEITNDTDLVCLLIRMGGKLLPS